MKRLLAPLASLRLTVVLFALSMVLIFAGTLAQRELGNWEVVHDYFRSFLVLIPLKHLLFVDVAGVLPFPGGFVLLGLMLVNLLAAYSTRVQFTPKRIGLLAIHGGLVLLIVGELVTALFAEEGMMMIHEGQGINFVEDLRESELVFALPDGDGQEQTVVVPDSMLIDAAQSGEPIRDERLPFEVRVLTWMPNSGIAGPQMTGGQLPDDNPATAGVGTRVLAMPQRPVTGVQASEINQPAAYIQLAHDGQDLGIFLVSTNFAGLPMFEPRQDVGDTGYQVALRFERTYKPYTLHLIEARHDVFVGTDIPRNFSSRLRLVDPEANEDREVLIWMNNPLRYRGDAIFQNQMGQTADAAGIPITGLQVVTNPGWMLPYISCALVGAGLTFYFGMMIWNFAGRTRSPRNAKTPPIHAELPWGARLWPGLATGVLAVLLVGSQLRPEPRTTDLDLAALAPLPVTAEGRVKPLDTVARNSLLIISGRRTAEVEQVVQKEGIEQPETVRISAMQWLLDVIARPELANEYPVFRVDHPDVKSLVGIGPDGIDRTRFTFSELIVHHEAIAEQASRAEEVASADRNLFQQRVLDLASHLTLYAELQRLLRPYAVPPLAAGEEWQPLAAALETGHTGHAMSPAAAHLATIFRAYRAQEAQTFDQEIAQYTQRLEEAMPEAMRKGRLEVLFNRLAPFYQGTVLYVGAFLFAFGAVLLAARENQTWASRLAVAAVTMLVLGLVIHTFGLAARIYLQGRPPVTNLYSSAVFIGWFAVPVGLLLEYFFRNRLGVIVAAVVGFSTLIIAHNLADGDTMQMMQAVLDSNFWLATHVITITVGYSAAFVAGAIGIALILLGVYTPYLHRERMKTLGKMMYGVVAFALFLSFIGTVLGGIWADQSWGRFWGWDPKENGAILIVLMSALILHARWGGMIQERGIAVLSVGLIIVTAWSWFGTNMLGVGLHSYGFMDSALFWLLAADVVLVAIMAAGLIPMHRWMSFANASAAPQKLKERSSMPQPVA